MATDLVFPRVLYRGPEDPTGMGYSETKPCTDAEMLEVDKKAGWRLERDPKYHAENAKKAKGEEPELVHVKDKK